MKKAQTFIAISIVCITWLHAQTITGTFPQLAKQTLQLKGFDGFKDYEISSTTIDSVGHFKLKYQTTDVGTGFLVATGQKPYLLILSGEDITLNGESLGITETIKTIKGQQNQWFVQYVTEHIKIEQALNAWNYLEKMYAGDAMFSKQNAPLKSIQTEKQRLNAADVAFIETLPKESYVRWFIPIHKLVSSVSVVVQYRPEEIPATGEALRKIDYADARLYKSGLFKESIESHVWFIENSSGHLDKVYANLNTSIDILIKQLKDQPVKLNEVTDYLFNLLERRSLFQSAEHLALKVLGDESCTIDDKVSSKLESYRAMKKGNQAPNIVFGAATKFNQAAQTTSLKEITSALKLVVFAAGWCSHCQEIMPKVAVNYPQWQAKGIEVVLVTLDGSQQEYETFTKGLPFITTSDLNTWDGQAVKDYHVFATPTMFLLDKDLKILLKPNSVEQVNSYLEYVYKR